MKYPIIIAYALFLLLTACEKETIRTTTCLPNTESEYPVEYRAPSICTTDTCTQYLAIWQELLQEKNNISQDYFDTHIEVQQSSLSHWNQGITFYICYTIQVDWAITYKCDKFIININAEDKYYPTLDLPRNTNLTKEAIETVVNNRVFSASIAKINATTEVQHLSLDTALSDLIEFSGVNTLCFTRIILDKDSGNLVLEALAKYDDEENACIRGSIDLITGEKKVLDNPCYIIG